MAVLKCPAEAYAGHCGAARLIEREWEFLDRLALPGVVPTLGLTAAATGPGLVTELLLGGDLVPLAGSHPRHWAGCLAAVAETLASLHRLGVVHGDIKPRNVLLDEAAKPSLIDFALAARIGEARPAGGGTPAYQHPRRAVGARADPDDDVYAFASMVHELIAGELPFGPVSRPVGLQIPPVSPLKRYPALAAEPAVVALAELAQAALTGRLSAGDDGLGQFRSVLHAIIAA